MKDIFTKRVLFIGGESSGKTTMCQTLADKHNWPWVEEYGRYLFDIKNGQLEYEDMLKIGSMQAHFEAVEDLLAGPEVPFILCDTSPLVTKFYSQEWFGKVDPALENLSHNRYDIIFFCMGDFPYVNDGTRSGEEFSKRQEAFYHGNLEQPYYILRGSIEQRVAFVEKILNV